MKMKKCLVATTLSVSAAIALSGATSMATMQDTKSPASSGVVSKVGKIISINLLSGTNGFSFEKVNMECCGPYQQCHCPDFKGT